jgi:hypothetical protein
MMEVAAGTIFAPLQRPLDLLRLTCCCPPTLATFATNAYRIFITNCYHGKASFEAKEIRWPIE